MSTRRRDLIWRRVYPVHGFWVRARGLLGHRQPEEGEAWLFRNCRAVHTFGMRYALDVIFIDDAGRLLRLVESLPPWRVAACFQARHVIEMRAREATRLHLRAGQRLSFEAPIQPEYEKHEQAAVAAESPSA